MGRVEELLLERLKKKGVSPRTPARGRSLSKKDEMNKLEQSYAMFLERDPSVVWVKWQPFKLRLADRTFYEPDFGVMKSDGVLEVHEVKGHWEDDARVKIKVAAETFPFRFIAVQRVGAEWKFENFF